ncbi:hypothetical protein F0L74_17775 [Chitinophaga agrisoli]|uniref:Response regulatory domain-containing protein n=1 Tax=Chitinophaga agrisoli TaxID=2607653 RepID=A0A5B2VSA5_9BACT|nr:hypothetical protein [Chitinophaga agrisoli]KAA2241724.1 hypothetical protein F0L74_17775 [Chitinophaga agrisoli]
MLRVKNIILLGNSRQELLEMQHQLHNLGGGVHAVIADLQVITELLHTQRADLIILYVATGEGIYSQYVHAIRRNRLADEVPLVVCREPLETEALEGLLRIK